jgi:hypothetical protein
MPSAIPISQQVVDVIFSLVDKRKLAGMDWENR